MVISGTGFTPRLVVEFDDGTKTQFDSRFSARLGDTGLLNVQLRPGGTLSALVPRGISPGVHPLVVVDPWGREGTLEAAYTAIDPAQIPAALAFASAPQSVKVGSCSAPVTVELRNSAGAAVPTETDVRVALSGTNLSIYSDETCATPDPTQFIRAGATSLSFFFRGETTGTFDLVANAPQYGSASQPETISAQRSCVAADRDGTPCDDGNACTLGDACQAGVCTPSATVTCAALDACHDVGTCDPATGACTNPPRPDGSSCDDGITCTSGETCHKGACGGATQVQGCANTAPVACLSVAPQAAVAGSAVALSAACSTDVEEAPSSLQARFDVDGDGVFDTTFGPLEVTHVYAAPGTFLATAEVRDSAGASSYVSRSVFATSAAQDVVVTTAADENDNGATPAAPGGTGLSLREAIDYANVHAGSVIRFASPMTLTATQLPRLTASDVAIIGSAGTVVDFGNSNGATACLILEGDRQRVHALALRNCAGPPLELRGTSSQVAYCDLTGTKPVVWGGSANLLGPGNDLHDFTTEAVRLVDGTHVVDGNRVHHSAQGIRVQPTTGGAMILQRNVVYANAGSGIVVDNGAAGPLLRHNTLYANGLDGVSAPQLSAPLLLRNNILSGNGRYGVDAASFSASSPNVFYDNAAASLSSIPDAPIAADPLFVNAASFDLRIRAESPAVNQGADLGIDVNGPGAGNFNGAAPDVGAHETP